MKNNYTDFPQSLRVPNMAPLDAKLQVNTLAELQDLGLGSQKAYSYYRGLMVYCLETKTRYEWTDVLEKAKDKVLEEDFTYPEGCVFDEVDYSNLSFNFIEFKSGGGSGLLINDEEVVHSSIRFNREYLAKVDYVLEHNLNIGLLVSAYFVYPPKLHTQQCPPSFSISESMMFEILESFEILDQNNFKLNGFSNYQNMEDEDYLNLVISYTNGN